MAFEKVQKDLLPVWNPRYTGSEKNDDIKPLAVTKKSFIEGYLMDSVHEQGKDKNTSIHQIKVTKVGDRAHVTGTKVEGKEDMCSVFGTLVLNSRLEQVAMGAMIRIVWTGKQKPQGGGKPYVIWDVLVDADVDPMDVAPKFSAPAKEATPEAKPEPAAAFDDDAEDNLPF